MREALKKVDVLVTSGGVSMGEQDLIKEVLYTDLQATLKFGRVKMKPGYEHYFIYLFMNISLLLFIPD